MPVCKNCHARIDKFNKDMCPVCGTPNPFEGVTSETVEITTHIDTDSLKLDYHPRKRSKLLLFFITLGIFGVPFFYLYKKKLGVIYALINLAVIAGLTVVFAIPCNIHIALAIVISVLFMIALNSIVGLIYYKKQNLKDGRGDFLI